jgi:Malectin-like domain
MFLNFRICWNNLCFILISTGFINVDCGLAADSILIESNMTEWTYVSDDKFIDTGENHMISSTSSILFKTLRSFPNGTRNCYTLSSLTMLSNYLVRASFFYGNYDNSDKPPIFDIHLGVNYWQTVNMTTAKNGDILSYEIIATASADHLQVCLVNKGLGTPFISVLELRELKRTMYSMANSTQSLLTVSRWNLGRFFDIVIPLIR